jgi:hypothetical protein
VFEAAEIHHALVQRVLARMSKGCVPQVMCEANRFGQYFVELERAGNRARDLRDFQRVRQPGSI